jgi:cytochrome c oxidase accessory protein FixG
VTPPLLEQRVLSTLNADGTRRWIKPRLARGRFLRYRKLVGYALIALFVALPFVRIGGRPALLLDLVTRELSVLGAVFRPSDGFLLMLLGLSIVLAVFLLTALFGRVWCGWACPQTVYMEFVFRPIERWLERRRALRYRTAIRWAIYSVIAAVLANVFLAYFVGVDRLALWVLGSPLDHPAGFSIVVGVAALVLFDFAYFREQTCIVACPYGRLQSVLLDKQSLIVGYDARRGEPRSKPKRNLPVVGDCVDCSACVSVCPTGIDIREGLQMECIGCAQCIDACDAVMDRVKKPRGLIGYTSQDVLAGKAKRLLRGRTIVYPLLLALVGGGLALGIALRDSAEVWVERTNGPSFAELPGGKIAAQASIKVENESDGERRYTISLAEAPDAVLRTAATWRVAPRKALSVPLVIELPRTGFTAGRRTVYVRIADNGGFHRIVRVQLLGPAS